MEFRKRSGNNLTNSDMKKCHRNNNNEAAASSGEERTPDVKLKPTEEEYSIQMIKKYPLGFNKTEKECEEEAEAEENDGNIEACSKRKTPRKKKKGADDNETENPDEGGPESIYNVWVPDCLRSKKDFVECQQINLNEVESKQIFEKVFNDNGFFSSATDYDDFLECGKGASTRILQGVETKFKVEIDVSDSFYTLTGAKVRAYSFQGSDRKMVFSAFSFFRCSWGQEMAINTITNYDQLFQPDNWYYSVIHIDEIKKKKRPVQDDEAVNVSNKASFNNKYDQEFYSQKDCNTEENLNQNRLNTNSEVDSIDNINNENKYSKICRKNDHIFKLCFKYLKAPKNKLQKLLFTSIKNETESISYTVSNMAKLVNENNNKKESLSVPVKENLILEGNYKFVNYLLDSHEKPIPIWIKF